MFQKTYRWTPPAPEVFYEFDGKSIDLIQALLDRSGDGWTVEFYTDLGDTDYAIIYDALGAVVMHLPRTAKFQIREDGTFKPIDSRVYGSTSPYPEEWL